MKSRVLYVIGSLNLGGAENQITELAIQIKNSGNESAIFVLNPEGPLKKRLQEHNIPIFDGKMRQTSSRSIKWYSLLRAILLLTRTAYKLRPDVIHSFLPLTNFISALTGRLTRVPLVIISRRSLGNYQDKSIVHKFLDKISNRLAHFITANSKAVLDDLVKRDHVNLNKTKVIYNSIQPPVKAPPAQRKEIRKQLKIATHEVAIVSIGNIIAYKGHLDLAKAAVKVLRDYKHVKFFVIGRDRGNETSLHQFIEKNNLTSRFTLLGRRLDARSLLSAMDLFVLPSHEEGFSNALLESLVHGLPTIATDVGGNPEALNYGEFGTLTKAKSPEVLVKNIINVLEDLDNKKHIANQNSLTILEKYSSEKNLSAHLDLYAKKSKCSV